MAQPVLLHIHVHRLKLSCAQNSMDTTYFFPFFGFKGKLARTFKREEFIKVMQVSGKVTAAFTDKEITKRNLVDVWTSVICSTTIVSFLVWPGEGHLLNCKWELRRNTLAVTFQEDKPPKLVFQLQ